MIVLDKNDREMVTYWGSISARVMGVLGGLTQTPMEFFLNNEKAYRKPSKKRAEIAKKCLSFIERDRELAIKIAYKFWYKNHELSVERNKDSKKWKKALIKRNSL